MKVLLLVLLISVNNVLGFENIYELMLYQSMFGHYAAPPRPPYKHTKTSLNPSPKINEVNVTDTKPKTIASLALEKAQPVPLNELLEGKDTITAAAAPLPPPGAPLPLPAAPLPLPAAPLPPPHHHSSHTSPKHPNMANYQWEMDMECYLSNGECVSDAKPCFGIKDDTMCYGTMRTCCVSVKQLMFMFTQS